MLGGSIPSLPPPTAKLRDQISTVFRHGIRWGWTGQHADDERPPK